jgi:hypothetical protein
MEESATYSKLKEGAHQQQTLLTREVRRLRGGMIVTGKTAPPFYENKRHITG